MIEIIEYSYPEEILVTGVHHTLIVSDALVINDQFLCHQIKHGVDVIYIKESEFN
jgi:hypothetical protein